MISLEQARFFPEKNRIFIIGTTCAGLYEMPSDWNNGDPVERSAVSLPGRRTVLSGLSAHRRDRLRLKGGSLLQRYTFRNKVLSVTYSLPQPVSVECALYTLGGKLIVRKQQSHVTAGIHDTEIDVPFSTGTYVLTLTAGSDGVARTIVDYR